MSQVPQPFEDPKLKAAVRQLEGSHAASDRLRALVAQRMASAEVPEGNPVIAPDIKPSSESSMRIGTRFRPLRWLAAAAVIAICIGGVWGYQHYRNAAALQSEYAKNDQLLERMIDVHKDAASGGPADRRLTAAMDDPVALANEASVKLGRPVPVIQLKAQGWALDAASICEIDNSGVARFHLTRGKESITVLSLPSTAWAGGKDGSRYDLVEDGFPIAGYLSGKSLNCIVGDASMQPKEISTLLDTIRGS